LRANVAPGAFSGGGAALRHALAAAAAESEEARNVLRDDSGCVLAIAAFIVSPGPRRAARYNGDLKKLLVALAAAAAVGALWYQLRRPDPIEVSFARVRRETLTSAVRTNGKIEPQHWSAARAERAGYVTQVHVERGQRIKRGALLAELATEAAEQELAAAEARVAEARTALAALEEGGRAAERAALEGSLATAREELAAARRELASLRRLLEKQAATKEEVLQAHDRVRKAELEIEALEKRRAALVAPPDRAAAEARLRQALADREQAARRLAQSRIGAPASGVVYDLPVRPGSWVQPGDLVAAIGRLETVRVTIYVDEPELGRVAVGMPILITWDALPGKQWRGVIQKPATRIVKLETRQVGEVSGVIENPEGELVPGANVNIEIRSRVVENALTIPKEALRRRGGEDGVLVLEGDRVAWRKVELGAASITRAEVLGGLNEGEAVALPADRELHPGDRVVARFREW
jgi:HlyD family secretion protein